MRVEIIIVNVPQSLGKMEESLKLLMYGLM